MIVWLNTLIDTTHTHAHNPVQRPPNKQIVQTSLYLGKLMHAEGRLASWARDAVLRLMVEKDVILKVGEQELINHCPVPLPSPTQSR